MARGMLDKQPQHHQPGLCWERQGPTRSHRWEGVNGSVTIPVGDFLPVKKHIDVISLPVQAGRGRAVGARLAVAFRNYPDIHNRR